MGFLSAALDVATLGTVNTGMFGGENSLIKQLSSGIPFAGDGIAAQQQRDFEADQARISRGFNAEEAQKNRDFQERMSNTAHQREMEDLKAAGLNPMLAVNAGSSTPTGSMATSSHAKGTTGSGGGDAANFLRDMYSKQRQQAEASIDKTRQEEKTAAAEEKLKTAAIKMTNNSANKLEKELQILSHQEKSEKAKGDWMQEHGNALMWMDMLNKGTSSARDIGTLVPGVKSIMEFFGGKNPPIGIIKKGR